MPITFDHTTLPQRVLFGDGNAVDDIARAIATLDAHRVVLIAGPSAAHLASAVADRCPIATTISDVVQHVPVEQGRVAVQVTIDAGADAIVTIGGGSAIGLAKFVARDTKLPIVAVPTTFAGSEATNVWGQTEGRRKSTGVDDHVLPRIIVYDATLTISLPPELAMSSGLNAIAHAVDSLWAPHADPINTTLATESVHVLIPALRTLHTTPDDVDARQAAIYGAYLAAVAFTSAGSGMHHKLCHVLGGSYNLPHAATHAIVLPHVTAFNAPAVPAAADRIAKALGTAVEPASGLWKLREALGTPASLSAIGLAETDIGEAAARCYDAIPRSNPRPFTVDDIEGIIHAAWRGAPPQGADRD